MPDEQKRMKEVLQIEYRAIQALEESLGDRHLQFLDMCKDCQGKLILTGMGKSGHVARKISATLASLGTPSVFMHPAEAAHGDLGMVEAKDIVIMISKSGETDELIQLVNSCKTIGCQMLGIFCDENSTLEKYCDLTVVLPIEREACVNNLAPTTSTTLTMAFGDAIAVALAEMRGFKKQDFALFHPKGTLGKQLLLTVEHLANREYTEIAVGENDSVKEILWTITKNRLGAVAVTDENRKLKGLITDGDIRRALEKNEHIYALSAREIMTKEPTYVNSDMLAVEAFRLMQERKISVLPLVDENQILTGIVSFHDIVQSGITGEKK